MTYFRIALFLLAAMVFSTPAKALTEPQAKAMYFHGMWEWVLNTCPHVYRSYGYWYAMKEVGEFETRSAVIENQHTKPYKKGWLTMSNSAKANGRDNVCKEAVTQWPAVLLFDDDPEVASQ